MDRKNIRITTIDSVSVALRKESVDRKRMEILGVSYDVCRSPQGERG